MAVIVWLAWKEYTRKAVVLTNTVTKNIQVVSSERYGESLRAISDSLLSPLDTNAPNPVAEITRLSATADADFRNGRISQRDAEVITRLCSTLQTANNEREWYETTYRGILMRKYSSFQGAKGEEEKRRFYLDDLLRKWVATAQSYRNRLSPDIAYLRNQERQWEYDESLRTTPSTVQ